MPNGLDQKKDPHEIVPTGTPSKVAEFNAYVEAIAKACNAKDGNLQALTQEATLHLVHTMIDEAYETEIKNVPQIMLPEGKAEDIISPRQLVNSCISLIEQMKADDFVPTHFVAIATGGLHIYYALNKLLGGKIPMISIGVQSYNGTSGLKLIDTSSPLFPLQRNLSAQKLAGQKFLIVDDLVERAFTVGHSIDCVDGLLNGKGTHIINEHPSFKEKFEALLHKAMGHNVYKEGTQPILKTAVLYAKRDDIKQSGDSITITGDDGKTQNIKVDYFETVKDKNSRITFDFESEVEAAIAARPDLTEWAKSGSK